MFLTPEQREALAADAAAKGKAMAQIVRDLLDAEYFGKPKTVAGWQIAAVVRRPEDTRETPPARARLREWISRSRRRS